MDREGCRPWPRNSLIRRAKSSAVRRTEMMLLRRHQRVLASCHAASVPGMVGCPIEDDLDAPNTDDGSNNADIE